MRTRGLDYVLGSTGSGRGPIGSAEQQLALAREALAAVRQDEIDEAKLFARWIRNRAALARALKDRKPRHAIAELAGTARIGQDRATTQYEIALRLDGNFPRVVELLDEGTMLRGTAEMLATITKEASAPVQVELGVRISDRLAPLDAVDARELIVMTLREVEADLGREEQERRHERARAGRGVWAKPVGNGMTRIGAEVDDLTAQRWVLDFEENVRAQARADKENGVKRTAQQRRADVFAELPSRQLALIQAMQKDRPTQELDEVAAAVLALPVRNPTVLNLHVPVSTSLGLDNCPGRIEGAGPIDALQLRVLRPIADVRRVFVSAETGIPIAMDARLQPPLAELIPEPRSGHPKPGGVVNPERLHELFEGSVVSQAPEAQHDPSAALRRLVDVRDQGCLGVGCSMPARCCDLDHRVEYGRPGGDTSEANRQNLSEGCHGLRHDGWSVTREEDGTTVWFSPLGSVYRRRPRWLPPPLYRRESLSSKDPQRDQGGPPPPQGRFASWDDGDPPPF